MSHYISSDNLWWVKATVFVLLAVFVGRCLCSFMAVLHWTVKEYGNSAGSEPGSSVPGGQLQLVI